MITLNVVIRKQKKKKKKKKYKTTQIQRMTKEKKISERIAEGSSAKITRIP